MTDTREATCAERVEAELAGRIAELKAIGDKMHASIENDEPDAGDDAQQELDEWPLCIDFKVTMTVQISTGGPGDQFEVEIEKGQYGWGLAEDYATYRFLDWFDGATTRTNDKAVMDYLSNVVECISPEWAGE